MLNAKALKLLEQCESQGIHVYLSYGSERGLWDLVFTGRCLIRKYNCKELINHIEEVLAQTKWSVDSICVKMPQIPIQFKDGTLGNARAIFIDENFAKLEVSHHGNLALICESISWERVVDCLNLNTRIML